MSGTSVESAPPRVRTSEEIRALFLDYFVQRGHKLVPSHALIPADDPTLLFVNAGMVQFKDVFVGRQDIGATRATSAQKCLRVSGKHNDLENVGRTARHHTFFEMLGNFSFGDYFKREAIEFAWTFLTSPEYLGLPASKLWVTVYPDDDEAYAIWRDQIGVPVARILRDPENFWSMGDTGPCGSCSEIHIDQGPALSGGKEVPFGQGGDRYLELWNLVFMQYDRDAQGNTTPLPRPSIDTGMGLERIAAVIQGKTSNYDGDLFRVLIQAMEARCSHRYEGRYAPEGERDPDIEMDVAFRVIADHARATAFLIADGVYPENEGRGYVLRRIMRRAIRFGRKLGVEGVFLHAICREVVHRLGEAYPELREAKDVIQRVVTQEEERFGRTLVEGLRLLESEMAGLEKSAGGSAPVLSGNVAFTLYDTHGFPVDLTRLITEERGIDVDEAGFESAMQAQRERGRASWKGVDHDAAALYQALADETDATEFVGYEWNEATATVWALVVDGERVQQVEAGSPFELFVDRTPFYAEGGGQVGDRGEFGTEAGVRGSIRDTQSRADGVVAHQAVITGPTDAVLRVGDTVTLAIDDARRAPTRRNHSATHLLHWALRTTLGEHVKQRGSMVAPDRLRFDFSHFGPVTEEELAQVERMVNERVVANAAVCVEELTYDDAIERGAIAFFGEKYGATVRVVSMAESVELCGGTHVGATGDIGMLKLVSETGISSGVRRIEAVTGMAAIAWVQDQEARWNSLARQLKAAPADLERRVEKLQRDQDALQKELAQAKSKLAETLSSGQADEAREIAGVKALAIALEGVAGKELRPMSDPIADRLGDGALFLASNDGGKVGLLVVVAAALEGSLNAGALIRDLAPLVGGRGGGKAHLAQAGGSDPSGIPAAIERFYELVAEALGG